MACNKYIIWSYQLYRNDIIDIIRTDYDKRLIGVSEHVVTLCDRIYDVNLCQAKNNYFKYVPITYHKYIYIYL